ncbi:MAG TPA: hypothetical protein VEN81_17760 [Planctomycetota bacterium]|nr:hypothetical protein [Planctomycetota bacterium]
MPSDRISPTRGGSFLETVSLFGLPALAAATFIFSLPGETRSQGEPSGFPSPPEPPPLCPGRHPGAGDSTPVDLAEIRRAYREIEGDVRRRLARGDAPPAASFARPYDAGLPACREEATRSVELPRTETSRLRGRRLCFLRVSDPARVGLPPELENVPGLEILVASIPHLGDLPEVSRRLGRPVALGSAGLARALGVRCASTWIVVSEKGDAAELHEVR